MLNSSIDLHGVCLQPEVVEGVTGALNEWTEGLEKKEFKEKAVERLSRAIQFPTQ